MGWRTERGIDMSCPRHVSSLLLPLVAWPGGPSRERVAIGTEEIEGGVDMPCAAMPPVVVVMAVSCGALRERAAVGEDTARETASQRAGCTRVYTDCLKGLDFWAL